MSLCDVVIILHFQQRTMHNFYEELSRGESSHGGLAVESALRIQLKVSLTLPWWIESHLRHLIYMDKLIYIDGCRGVSS